MEIVNLFNSIDTFKIDEFIKEQEGENLHLEFKVISSADLSKKEDRKNFAIALSGFANADGGVVIWGIQARKNNQGVDCANNKKPIDNLSLFISKLNEFTGQFVNPIVEGVRHDKIELRQNVGFIKSYIPQSDTGPHMAKAGEDRYYKRSGSSFHKMEHFDIEDMFGRRKKPKLEIFTKIKRSSVINDFHGCKIIIGIKNIGKGLAKYPYLALNITAPYVINDFGLNNSRSHGLPRLPHSEQDKKTIFGGDANSVIHVNSELEVTSIEFYIKPKTMKLVDQSYGFQERGELRDVAIDYEIAAEDMILKKDTLVINKEKILEIMGT